MTGICHHYVVLWHLFIHFLESFQPSGFQNPTLIRISHSFFEIKIYLYLEILQHQIKKSNGQET